MKSVLVAGLLVIVAAGYARAASLAPAKASSVVTLRSAPGGGCNSNDRVPLNTNAATDAAFTVPSGSVLVLTDLFFASPAGGVLLPSVELNDGTNTAVVSNIPITSTAGTSSGWVHLISPLVVKSGQLICVGETPLPSGFTARGNGYLAKDK